VVDCWPQSDPLCGLDLRHLENVESRAVSRLRGKPDDRRSGIPVMG
jgi:hypothetical protein